MTELLSQSAYAKHCGVGRSAVSNWKKDGLLVMVGKKVDVAASDARRGGAVDPGKGRPATGAKTGKCSPEKRQAPEPPKRKRVSDTLSDDSDDDSDSIKKPTLESERIGLIREQRASAALKNTREAGELAPVIEMERLLTESGRMFLSVVKARLRGSAEKLAKASSHREVMALLDSTIDKAGAEVADRLEALRTDSE